jgi:hypothetical protein
VPDASVQLHALRPVIAFLRAALFLLATALLLGCGARTDPAPIILNDLPSRAAVAGVPLIKQDDFYCGPASLAMVLRWSGLDVSQAEIAATSFSPGAKGTFKADMTGAARRRGQLAVGLSTLPELLAEVAAGHPIIVFQNLGLSWAPKWHYAVVVGFDVTRDEIVLHSGELDRMTMPVDLFLRTWRRGDQWALVVLPPDRLPAMDDQWEIARSVAALERAGQPRAAERAYSSGAARWPENWIWPYGLGNARYQRGDLSGAAQAFERAMAIDPAVPEVRHNLREVRAEMAGSGG